MKEESAREGIHYKGSPGTWDFRYELVMLRNAQCRTLAISRGTLFWGCENYCKGGMVETLVIFHPNRGEGHIIGLGRDVASLLA
jgi:hypothetical protein